MNGLHQRTAEALPQAPRGGAVLLRHLGACAGPGRRDGACWLVGLGWRPGLPGLANGGPSIDLNPRTPIFAALSPWGHVVNLPRLGLLEAPFEVLGVLTPIPPDATSFSSPASAGEDLGRVAARLGIDLDLLASANNSSYAKVARRATDMQAPPPLLARQKLGPVTRVPLSDESQGTVRRQPDGEGRRAHHREAHGPVGRVPLEHRAEVPREDRDHPRDERPPERPLPQDRAGPRGPGHGRVARHRAPRATRSRVSASATAWTSRSS